MAEESRTERALVLAKRIEVARQDLDRARAAVVEAEARLKGAVREFEALMGPSSTEERTTAQMSRASQIVELLEQSPATVWSITGIAGALSMDNVGSLRATLNRLVETSRIERSARGEYRARQSEYYEPGQR
jgi:hypothetical protein